MEHSPASPCSSADGVHAKPVYGCHPGMCRNRTFVEDLSQLDNFFVRATVSKSAIEWAIAYMVRKVTDLMVDH